MATISHQKRKAGGAKMKPIGENYNSISASYSANFAALEDVPSSQFILQTLGIQSPGYAEGSIPKANPSTGVSVQDSQPQNSVHYPQGVQGIPLMSISKNPVNNFNGTSELPSSGNLLYYRKPVGNFTENLAIGGNKYELIEFGGVKVLTRPSISVTDLEAHGMVSSKQVAGSLLLGYDGLFSGVGKDLIGPSDIGEDIFPPYDVLNTAPEGNQETLPSNIAFQTFTANDFKRSSAPMPFLDTTRALQRETVQNDRQFDFINTVNSSLLGNMLTWQTLGFGPQVYVMAQTSPNNSGFAGFGTPEIGATGVPPFGSLVQSGRERLPRDIVSCFVDYDVGSPNVQDFYLFLKGVTNPGPEGKVRIQVYTPNTEKLRYLTLNFSDAGTSTVWAGSAWAIIWNDVLNFDQLWRPGSSYGVQLLL